VPELRTKAIAAIVDALAAGKCWKLADLWLSRAAVHRQSRTKPKADATAK
jgi:hypothetical protein